MKDNRTVSVEINDITHYTRWIHKPSHVNALAS